MWKRVALLGTIAALTISNPSGSFAAVWGAFAVAAAAATGGLPESGPLEPIQYYPAGCCNYHPRPAPCCARPYYPRPCCARPYYPRPCCYGASYRPYYRPYYRPPYFYGDSFAPYAYNPYRYDAGYGYDGYDGYDGYGGY
jgi:hypothetical protein